MQKAGVVFFHGTASEAVLLYIHLASGQHAGGSQKQRVRFLLHYFLHV